ncbi:MAG: Flp pilus assembly protein TadD, contains TPR repeats [Chloroflexi bacterium]|jgi:tetratricopeptide (TPR) repeat protein|nr:MAG: Flp pilus assembly protein TadD, contains TPR repeats [Chloroflexota bacterium]
MSISQAEIAMEIAMEKNSKRAAELAMQGKWEKAVTLNHEILSNHPENVDALNRLGKSLLETGQITDAIDAFKSAINLSPNNPIATKNLHKLTQKYSSESIKEQKLKTVSWPKSANEEYGKVALVDLVNQPNKDALAGIEDDEEIELAIMDKIVKAISINGARIGQVEPKLGARISKLIKAGNKYKAFIRKIDGNRVKLLIREIYQHPSQIRVVSFPNIDIQNNRETHLDEQLQIPQQDSAELKFDLNEEWEEDDPQNGTSQKLYPQVNKILNQPNRLIEDY